jgi:hypothetical protein
MLEGHSESGCNGVAMSPTRRTPPQRGPRQRARRRGLSGASIYARSTSPSDSARASRQANTPAPVRSRRALTSFAAGNCLVSYGCRGARGLPGAHRPPPRQPGRRSVPVSSLPIGSARRGAGLRHFGSASRAAASAAARRFAVTHARDEVTLAHRRAGASRGRGYGTKDGREEAAVPTYEHFTSRRSVLADGAGADARQRESRRYECLPEPLQPAQSTPSAPVGSIPMFT